jgi:hypothetical protein
MLILWRRTWTGPQGTEYRMNAPISGAQGAQHPDHTCPRPGCEATVRYGHLMCPADWFRLPRPIRKAVNATWRHGAGAGTPAYNRAMTAAIAYLWSESAPGTGDQY